MESETLIQDLLGQSIPAELRKLASDAENLEKAANYCEFRYCQPDSNQSIVLDETKRLTLQSMASVAFNCNQLFMKLWSAMVVEADKLGGKQADLKTLKTVMEIEREKAARREVGRLANERPNASLTKVSAPLTMNKASRYQRCAIDYDVLDGLGHGAPAPEQALPRSSVNRAHSVVSGDSVAYGSTQLNNNAIYERWLPTQTPHGMYSQDTLRLPKDYSNYAYSTVGRRHPSQVGGVYMSSGSTVAAYGHLEEEPLPPPPGIPDADSAPFIERVRVLYPYTAAKEDELNLTPGDIVCVLRKNEDGWDEGIMNGVTGLFPDNYVERID